MKRNALMWIAVAFGAVTLILIVTGLFSDSLGFAQADVGILKLVTLATFGLGLMFALMWAFWDIISR